jgi:polyisoprenoid-binding protein YceI
MTFFKNVNRLTNPIKWTLFIASMGSTFNAQAQWQLINESSQLNFISTKATHIGEAHQFTALKGSVDNKGKAELTVDLTSVETMIPIRNKRMGSLLFESGQFPTAVFDTQIDLTAVSQLGAGQFKDMNVEGSLTLGNTNFPLIANVRAIKLSEKLMQIQTLKPIMLNAQTLSLAQGVAKLRAVAGLPSISHSVPVSFSLIFAD